MSEDYTPCLHLKGGGSWTVGAGSCLQCVGGNSGQGSAAGEI